jgi:manganese/zinc/iron transport system ATP- binding protein
MDALRISDLVVSYRGKPAVWGAGFAIPEGKLAGIIGPNGAGKSSLLKAVVGLLPSEGHIEILGRSPEDARPFCAFVPQREEVDWDFPIRVSDVVLMGRYGRLGIFQRPKQSDREAAARALEEVGMQDFARRQISELSGGQQQRVFLARALCQDANLYFFDEPFAGVDAKSEQAIFAVFRKLRAAGKTLVCVHHDLISAQEYFDYVVLLNGRVLASGPVDEVLSADNLAHAYGAQLPLFAEIARRVQSQERPRE